MSDPLEIATNPTFGIVAVGSYAPQRIVSNADFAARLDTTDEWIKTRTGILERHFAAPDETSSSMGIAAAQQMNNDFPQALDGIDLIICATSSPDAMFPSTAALIGAELGLRGAAAFDVSVACSGFVYALSVAYSMLRSGVARRALVVGSEVMSRSVDQTDRNTAILFGDGAGCVVLGEVKTGYGIESFVLGADGAGAEHLYLRGAAQCLRGAVMNEHLTQNGREVFKFAVRTLGDSAEAAMNKLGKTAADIDWLVPHQANIRIIEAACERFGLPISRAVTNLERYGNTSAASIPLALHEGVQRGLFKQGDHLLLAGFGGGLSWGTCVLRWSIDSKKELK